MHLFEYLKQTVFENYYAEDSKSEISLMFEGFLNEKDKKNKKKS